MRALTKKHLIKEQSHDLFLRKFLLDLISEERLGQFSCNGLLASKKVIACELLGKGAATALNVATFQEL